MTTNDKKNFTASLLEKAARGSAKVAVNSRCMYCLHQPKAFTDAILRFAVLGLYCSCSRAIYCSNVLEVISAILMMGICSENCLKSIRYAFIVFSSRHFCELQYSK